MKSKIKIQVIEPPIYDEFNWEMDKIIPALEFLRLKLPDYLTEIPKAAKYYLFRFEDKFGNPYPAIAIDSSNPEVMNLIPDFHLLYEKVEEIVLKQITIANIKLEIKNHQIITWEKLKQIKYYPKD